MKVDEIVGLDPRWNRAFVDYARRRIFGRAHRSRDTVAKQDWKKYRNK